MSTAMRRISIVLAVTGLGVSAGVIVLRFTGESDEERFRAGLKALRHGDPNEAAARLGGMSESPEFRDHRQLLRGGILLRSGRPAEAESWLKAVDREGELCREALLFLGECYYRQQRLAEGEICFRQIADDDADDLDAHRWLSSIYYDLGRVTAAITQLQHVIRLAPSDFSPYRFLGNIYQSQRKFTQAADAYQQALSLSPPADIKQELHLDLARLLVEHQDYDCAIALLDGAQELAGNPAALSIRAECACALGQKTEAKRMVAEVLDALPDDRNALLLKARIAKDEQDWDHAVSTLSKLLKSHPHDFEARYMLGRTYAMKGDRENSERELKLSENSKSLKARASELTERANNEPANAAVREELAGVCDELGEPELATTWRRAALALQSR